MAVQVAKLFGAAEIVAAGRDTDRLATLGEAAADVDFVIDYIWGEPTGAAMVAVVSHRADRAKPLTWIEIGSIGGATAPIPSAALRAARLSIVGSGQGSVSTRAIVTELPDLAKAITSGTFRVDARPMPLREVEQAWREAGRSRRRIVVVPGT